MQGLPLAHLLYKALWGCTIGKRFLGLEVRDVDGGPVRPLAALYRNLFRVELLLPNPGIVPMLSLAVLVFSRRNQRPGDLLADTVVVQRAP